MDPAHEVVDAFDEQHLLDQPADRVDRTAPRPFAVIIEGDVRLEPIARQRDSGAVQRCDEAAVKGERTAHRFARVQDRPAGMARDMVEDDAERRGGHGSERAGQDGKVGVAGLYTTANEDFFSDHGGGEEELLPGYQIGLGIETAVTDNMTIGVEGLYTAATESLVTDNLQIDQVALKPEVLTGKVSLKFHF